MEKDNKQPVYKRRAEAGVLTDAVTWYDAIAQAITAAFGN